MRTHVNSEVQKPPSQMRLFTAVNHNQSTNLETEKHTKWIKIHQTQITNHDLLSPSK